MRICGPLTLVPFALAFATAAHAQESNITSLPSQSAPPKPVVENGGRFAAPNGPLGAGLSFDPAQIGRLYAEGAIMHQEPQGGGHLNSLTWVIGGGFKVTPNVELEALLPMGFVEGGDPTGSDSAAAVGNLHLGASYLMARDQWRLKVGGGIEWGPWTHDLSPVPFVALALGHPARGGQDIGLWAPDVFSIVTPARFEYGEQLVGTVDAALGLHIPTQGGNTEFSIQIDPGVGYYVVDNVLLGARVPFTWVPTSDGDNTFLAIEPYARFDFDQLFVSTRFTLNLNDPYGFGFDSGKYWAWHVGLGGSF